MAISKRDQPAGREQVSTIQRQCDGIRGLRPSRKMAEPEDARTRRSRLKTRLLKSSSATLPEFLTWRFCDRSVHSDCNGRGRGLGAAGTSQSDHVAPNSARIGCLLCSPTPHEYCSERTERNALDELLAAVVLTVSVADTLVIPVMAGSAATEQVGGSTAIAGPVTV